MSGKDEIILVGKKQTWHGIKTHKEGGNGGIYELLENKHAVAKVFKNNEHNPANKLRKKRFKAEIDFLKNHNNKNEHLPLFIDENQEGEPLFVVMKKYLCIDDIYRKNISYEEKLSYCLQLIDAIEYIHFAETAHRDIKPANLLFQRKEKGNEYILILSDYGLISSDDLDSPGDEIGSFGFTPPELRDRSLEIDASGYSASDVYEFAKTVYSFLGNMKNSFSDSVSIIGVDEELKLGRNSIFMEPIYQMIEESIRSNMQDRITINECRNYIEEALFLINEKHSEKWESIRIRRRGISKAIKKADYTIKDEKEIHDFVLSVINNSFYLEIDRFFYDCVFLENGISTDLNGSLYNWFQIKDSQGINIKFVIVELVIKRVFNNEYIIRIKKVNADGTFSSLLEECVFKHKSENSVYSQIRFNSK